MVKKASIRFPTEPTTKRCWIGSYGGHISCVVVFSKKPVKAPKSAYNPGEYCILLNKDIIAGTFDLEQFNLWFGTDIEPDATEIIKVEPYDLTAIWNEYDQIYGLETDAD